MKDVTIVGAGPIGLFLAQHLKTFEVEIFEEHKEVGKPVQCAGLISRNVGEILKIPHKSILNTVRGAKLISPGGEVIELDREEDTAYVIDREIFDKELSKGLSIHYGKKVSDLNFNSKFIIGADGPASSVAQLADFPALDDVIPAVQYEVENKNYHNDFVEMYFGNKIAPGFFIWIIPTGKNLRIGIAAKENAKKYLDDFIQKKFGGPEIICRNYGAIPLKWRKSFVKGNIALVGDAAGQVKPSTGGGIYTGMRSARILAGAIISGNLGTYEQEWEEKVLPELEYNLRIRNFMNKLSDSEIDHGFKLINNRPEIKNLILSHGDMDKPGALIKALIKDPKIIAYALPYLKYFW